MELRGKATVGALRSFLGEHGDGPDEVLSEARALLAELEEDERAFEAARRAGTRGALEGYLRRGGCRAHEAQARERLERLDREVATKAAWEAARKAGTGAAVEAFLRAHPDAPTALEAAARTLLQEIREDEAAWERARRATTREAVRAYLLERRGRKAHEAEAREMLGVLDRRRAEAAREAAREPGTRASEGFPRGHPDASPGMAARQQEAERRARLVRRGLLGTLVTVLLWVVGPQVWGILERALSPPPAPGAAPGCPEGMALIPAGEFGMGSPEGRGDADEHPLHRVWVDAFCMDVHEVTNRAYEGFDGGHRSKRDRYSDCDDCPVSYASWDEAKRYCEARGKRLPTEAEWEKACRGGLEGKAYPWGDGWDGSKASNNRSSAVAVGSYGANAYGLHDMSGNVWEWVSDWYSSRYYGASPWRNPTGPGSDTARGCRGGSWRYGPAYLRCANRDGVDPARRGDGLGFRCARTPSL